MADYINKNILCQAYVHVEPDKITDELIEELSVHLNEFVKSRAEFFLYPNPEIDIELKEGSIKIYATILGTITTLFAGVTNYPDFREGAILLYEDVKRLSDYIASESIFSTKARHHQIIRVEARTGVIGSVKKIITDLDAVKSLNGTVQADSLTAKLFGIKEDIGKLLENLKSSDDEVFVKNGFSKIIDSMPKTPLPPPRKQNHPDQIAAYRDEIKAIKELLKVKP